MQKNLLKTGIKGLDEILNGGLISERFYLVRGGPGTGKTTLGLHFLIEGLKNIETGKNIKIFSDSSYLINGITRWIKKWKNNNWKTSGGNKVKNQRLWEEAENLLLLTIKGTIKMIDKENLSFADIVNMVATRGGITEAGIKVFRKEIPPVMEEFFDITLNKHEEIKDDLGKKFE